MDDFGIVYIIENAQQFWSELEDILRIPKDANLGQLDNTLARFVTLCTTYHEQFLPTPVQLEHACGLLLESELFSFHSERMRERLLEEGEKTTDPHAQLIMYQILLQYGRMHSSFLRSHRKWKPLLPLLMDHVLLEFDPEMEDLVTSSNWNKALPAPIEANLRILSVQILYEVCRVQKFTILDLRLFDDNFIDYLFDLVEQTRHMQDECLNYSLIKLIVALNEQFMVATMSSSPTTTTGSHHNKQPSSEDNNRVLRVLMRRLNSSKTFGENMIFMLNRAGRSPEDLCMQLLILKILYLLFTTKGTSEYFYTNDLRVLVDVFLRELVDLDEDSESLKHTYLRVLHPLLTRTQLRTVPYKRPQIVRTLEGLISHSSIREVNATTKRLVERCLSGDWCVQLRRVDSPGSDSSGLIFGFPGRIDSPGVDSIASATRSEFETPSPSPDVPRQPKPRERSQSHSNSVKTSRSVGNLRHAAHGSNGVRVKVNTAGHALTKQHSEAGSTMSLQDISAALPPPRTMPTSPSSLLSPSSSSKAVRSSSYPDPQSSLNSSLDQLSEACTPTTSSYHRKIPSNEAHATAQDSLGTVVDSIVAPSPLRPPQGCKPSSQSSSSESGSRSDHDRNSVVTKTRRAAPSPPQRRRKPPAIPVVSASRTPGGETVVTIASSHPTSPSRLGNAGSPLKYIHPR